MPRPRYQITEEDVPVVRRWVRAKCRAAADTGWDQVPCEYPTATRLQQ